MTAATEDRELRILRLVDGFRASDDELHAHVARERERLAAERRLDGEALRDALVDELVEAAALRSALIGGTAALPFVLPWLGPWISLAVKVMTGTLLQLANEVALVHQIAAAYASPLEPERRQMVAWWLVRLTNYEDLRDRAVALGVRISVRRLVEKLIAVGLTRAAAATATGMMSRLAMSTSGAPAPWYVSAVGLLGVPVLAVLGYRSTRAVGERTRAYFQEEQELLREIVAKTVASPGSGDERRARSSKS